MAAAITSGKNTFLILKILLQNIFYGIEQVRGDSKCPRFLPGPRILAAGEPPVRFLPRPLGTEPRLWGTGDGPLGKGSGPLQARSRLSGKGPVPPGTGDGPSGEVSRSPGEVSESSGEVSRSSGEVSESSGEVSRSSGEVSESSGEVSRSSGEVSESPGTGGGAAPAVSWAFPHVLPLAFPAPVGVACLPERQGILPATRFSRAGSSLVASVPALRFSKSLFKISL
jgi:hypothetical protein